MMLLAKIVFRVMLLVLLLASIQAALVRVSAGLLAAVEGGSEAQGSVLCILQGNGPESCVEGLK